MLKPLYRFVVLSLLFAAQAQAQATCRWTGELNKDMSPQLVNCPPEVVRYLANERQCRLAKVANRAQPAFCAKMADERATLYRTYIDKDRGVYTTIGTYLNSVAIKTP